MNRREAYIVLKALEAAEKTDSPLRVLNAPPDSNSGPKG